MDAGSGRVNEIVHGELGLHGSGPVDEPVDMRHQHTAWSGLGQIIIRTSIQYAGNHGRIIQG